MKSTVERCERVTTEILPKGEHQGLWSGYTVRVGEFRLECTAGIRGMNVPCTVVADENGNITVSANT